MEKTTREQILELLSKDYDNKEIAARLNISVHTVKSYVFSLLREGKIKEI
ncbi:MAG: LuxR C-terminal-related transcriptional regulator [Candidatus Gastranaerophilaceae bacterium]